MNNFEMSMRGSERSHKQQMKQNIHGMQNQDDDIASDEENQNGNPDGNEYDVEDVTEQDDDDDEEEDEENDSDSDVRPESDDEQTFQIDENTLMAIIKVQAHIRGFLTRKMIYEHLEQLVYQNQMLYNQNGVEDFDGYGEEGEGEGDEDQSDANEYDDEDQNDQDGKIFDENGNQIYQYQDAV